jgi:hypothetical protein
LLKPQASPSDQHRAIVEDRIIADGAAVVDDQPTAHPDPGAARDTRAHADVEPKVALRGALEPSPGISRPVRCCASVSPPKSTPVDQSSPSAITVDRVRRVE